MSRMNISLPDDMKAFVDEQVRIHGFATTGEYMRALIRERKDAIERLRALVIEGMESGDGRPAAVVSARLRARVEAARPYGACCIRRAICRLRCAPESF